MRIGLIAALRRSDDGRLRAALPILGRTVLARQATWLRNVGAELVLCLVDEPSAEILALQHVLEAGGVQFHLLNGFSALPGLVRAEDDLIVLLDGLLPDAAITQAVLGRHDGLIRTVATIPANHPLAAEYAEDFERIDAQWHWAGVLAMRGAPVQKLDELPADVDAISVLLRLALQAGTPRSDLTAHIVMSDQWCLAQNAVIADQHGQALLAEAAPPANWRRPGGALAVLLVRALAPRGLLKGRTLSAAIAATLLLAGALAAAFGFATLGLGLAVCGALGAEVERVYAMLAARLERAEFSVRSRGLLPVLSYACGAAAAGFALAPIPDWQPLAVLGPVTIGLARLVERGEGEVPDPLLFVSDRLALLAILMIASSVGIYPEALACLALGLLAGLLLHRVKE